MSVGGAYTMGDVVISGGVRYVIFGDAFAETANTARAEFTGSSALAVGMSIAYRF